MPIELRDFYETGDKINTEPRIYLFEDFLDAAEIAALLEAAKPTLQQALVSDAQSGIESAGRTGSNCWVAHDYNKTIADLADRIAQIVGVPLENAESFQVVHYAESELYAPHFDAWEAGTERGERCMARGGQRMVTCLLYLNDVAEGGGTSFPDLDLEVRARKGRMLLFHNCHSGSVVRHPLSLHGGMPVERGEKWACNLWFRERSYQVPKPALGASSSPAKRKFKRVV